MLAGDQRHPKVRDIVTFRVVGGHDVPQEFYNFGDDARPRRQHRPGQQVPDQERGERARSQRPRHRVNAPVVTRPKCRNQNNMTATTMIP